MLQEFKKFALRGNVVDLAIGVIIGAAFGKIVDALVGDVIMPVVGRLFGGLDFTNYFIGLTTAASQAPTYDAAKKAGAASRGHSARIPIPSPPTVIPAGGEVAERSSASDAHDLYGIAARASERFSPFEPLGVLRL